MARTSNVLIVTRDADRRRRWRRALDASGHLRVSADGDDADLEGPPTIIVTDDLPVREPLGLWAATLQRGEVGVIGIGCAGAADVLLPADHGPRELRLACRLLAQIVHLRAQLTREKTSGRLLQRLANTDPLTGLPNRRAWDELLPRRMCEPHVPERRRCLVLVDVDHFKRVNDKHGHALGDEVLRSIGQELASCCRRGLYARLGGDEFALLLKDVGARDVADTVDRIRRRAAQVRHLSAGELHVTASAGYVLLKATHTADIEPAMMAADRALRKAKTSGRDRSVRGELPTDQD